MIKIYLIFLLVIVGFLSPSLAKSPKTSLRKAYQVSLAVAAAATIMAQQKQAEAKEEKNPEAEREANMYNTMAAAAFQAGIANYVQYKKFNSDKDESSGSIASTIDPNVSSAHQNLDSSHVKNNKRLGSRGDREGADEKSLSLGMNGLDPSQILSSNMSREDFSKFLESKDMPEMPQIDVDTDKNQDNRLSTNLNFIAYGGGGESRENPNFRSLLGGLFDQDKKANPDYVGNIPLKYLEPQEADIWKRISATTRKHLIKN